ncbi:DUF6463 family protein [Paenibacillus flagellatus]|uniref:DUF4064 domain-containing protein n=1 Tax=Paenibacillus flagellatus TaxID=2211139 RepID=A0A2V5L3D7_9BACL|nr:DUF6463 family protein [Paenibacillus flagellatus]PYI57326.1 hypothetical protein DLM86_02480 [Paenibacillus flagellatus]
MVSGIKRQIGLTLMLTGLIHTVLGLIGFMEQLRPMVAEGLWDTVGNGQWDRSTAFWYLMLGFMLIALGHTVDWLMKKKRMAPPVSLGWMLLAICLIGVIVMPSSGFWLGLPQAWLLFIHRSPKQK